MLCQCIHSNQKDWVSKLPEIEFAINSAWSESTGYAPFFLNFSRMPQMMLWSSAPSDKYPAVWDFALEKKLALMSAHDSILSAQIKQTHDANKKQKTTPFKKGDLVYLSSKNILFVKGLACKLVPKFFRALPHSSRLWQCIVSARPTHPSQMTRNPQCIPFFIALHPLTKWSLTLPWLNGHPTRGDLEANNEWAGDQIISHAGSGADTVFKIKWKSGDITWLPYY